MRAHASPALVLDVFAEYRVDMMAVCARGRLGGVISFIGLALLVTAVLTELRKPAQARQWHGQLFGLFPYELRPPTLTRLRRHLWNPDEPRVITGTAFGVGWTVNFAALVRALTS